MEKQAWMIKLGFDSSSSSELMFRRVSMRKITQLDPESDSFISWLEPSKVIRVSFHILVLLPLVCYFFALILQLQLLTISEFYYNLSTLY